MDLRGKLIHTIWGEKMHSAKDAELLVHNILPIISEHYEKDINWLAGEIVQWKERVLELEVENMMIQGDFEYERKINLDVFKNEIRERGDMKFET